jgi:GTP-binding protein
MSIKKNFIDRAVISVQAGDGGNGASHFYRAKYVPLGGPDGGDGGHGGSVIFIAEEGLNTLLDFSYRREHKAQPGNPGMGKKKYGKQGQDRVVQVPVGTVVLTREGELVADLTRPGQREVIAKGGRGGRGNVHFATALRRAPKLAEKGEPGEERELILELKLLADVGLIGLPNSGKSTLLSSLSAARPKIAAYPFTTLTPHLGQVKIGGEAGFLMVDIPGLIEKASQGQGLGHEFLRHVERTRLLIHLVDIGFPEVKPLQAFKTINLELERYHPDLAKRPQIIALNKADLVIKPGELDALVRRFKKGGREVFVISAAARQGVLDLARRAYTLLKSLPTEAPFFPRAVEPRTGPQPRFILESMGSGCWRLKGREAEKWVAMTDFNNEEAVAKLKNIFYRLGITAAFKEQGAVSGDTVKVGKEEFYYREDM